jgi:hypothetical protein
VRHRRKGCRGQREQQSVHRGGLHRARASFFACGESTKIKINFKKGHRAPSALNQRQKIEPCWCQRPNLAHAECGERSVDLTKRKSLMVTSKLNVQLPPHKKNAPKHRRSSSSSSSAVAHSSWWRGYKFQNMSDLKQAFDLFESDSDAEDDGSSGQCFCLPRSPNGGL